ncbi:MAG: exopolysaccharide biosynthesis protein [Rhodobacteraceae bacterium]|nr:exopolysaccharide biosynthesis protein [Paracoccaceae bacterium]
MDQGVGAGAAAEEAASERLERLAHDAPSEKVTLGWILDQLHERAFGLFLLVLALPCCIPFLYGIPQIVSLPLLFVSFQIVMGRRTPWLPDSLREREVQVSSLEDLSNRAGPWLKRIEKLSKPRLSFLTRAPIDRLIGVFLLLFSASIMLPLPSTNTVPGIAVAIVSIGLLQRDGLLTAFGMVLGTAWIATLVFLGATIVSVLKDYLGG